MGESDFTLCWTKIVLTCFYCQSVGMNKMWSTLHFLDCFFFMFQLWLLFGFHRPIIKKITFVEWFKGLSISPRDSVNSIFLLCTLEVLKESSYLVSLTIHSSSSAKSLLVIGYLWALTVLPHHFHQLHGVPHPSQNVHFQCWIKLLGQQSLVWSLEW